MTKPEKRSGLVQPALPTFSPPFVYRIMFKARTDMRKDDEAAKGGNPREIQTWYSLEDHHDRVSKVCSRVAEFLGLEAYYIMVAGAAGFLHDWGKHHPKGSGFRYNRILSPEEKEDVRTHPEMGARWIEESKDEIREGDRRTVEDIRVIVENHDSPWMVEDPHLRLVCFVVNLSDRFVARMERRDDNRKELSQRESIDKLKQKEEENLRDPDYERFKPQIQKVLGALEELYKLGLAFSTK